jgi:hypothetical protein
MATPLSTTLRSYCTVRFLEKYDAVFKKNPSNKLNELSKKLKAAAAKTKAAMKAERLAWDEYMAFLENIEKINEEFDTEVSELEAMVSNITESSAVYSVRF